MADLPRRLQIVWEGNFAGSLSLAQVNVALVRRLIDRADLSIVPRATDGELSASGVPADLQKYIGRQLPRVDVHVTHGIPVLLQRPQQGRWAWMQPWEYGAALPLDWLQAMQQADVILANSSHVAECMVEAGLPGDRVAVAPLGIDSADLAPTAPPYPLQTKKSFRFLYVGGLLHRKGIDLLLKTYRATFTARDDVALVIKPVDPEGLYRDRRYPDFEAEISGADAPEVVILPTTLAPGQIPTVYAACHSIVHPYRGEAFCLPLAEAMAMGLLAICTDRGGASDFCNSETAWLLPSDVVYFPHLALLQREVSNFPHWQEADTGSLAAAMRRAVSDGEARLRTAARGRQFVRERLTWEFAADALMATFLTTTTRERRTPADPCPAPSSGANAEGIAESLLSAADLLLQIGDLESSGRLYHRALRYLLPHLREPGARSAAAARALCGMARLSIANRIDENGFLFAERAVICDPTSVSVRQLAAEMALRTGRNEVAENHRRAMQA